MAADGEVTAEPPRRAPDRERGQEPGGAAGLAGAPGQEAARLICLRLLTAGPRTRAQLAEALRRRQVPDDIAGAVLARLAEVGLIDDSAFAQAWVESRHQGQGLGRRRLAAELHRRGVGDEDVRTAVGVLSPADEVAAARRLIAQRVAGTRGRPMPARMRRLVGLLARRGYPAGLAFHVVREALEQDSLAAGGPDAGGSDCAGAGDARHTMGDTAGDWPGEGESPADGGWTLDGDWPADGRSPREEGWPADGDCDP